MLLLLLPQALYGPIAPCPGGLTRDSPFGTFAVYVASSPSPSPGARAQPVSTIGAAVASVAAVTAIAPGKRFAAGNNTPPRDISGNR